MADIYSMVQKPALVAPSLPVPQQVGDEWGGLGSRGHFWNNAEEYWKPTFEAIDNIWNTYDTIPVHRNKYKSKSIGLETTHLINICIFFLSVYLKNLYTIYASFWTY